MIRLLIADDHEVVRNGFRDMLRHEEGIHIARSVATGSEALYYAQKEVLDILVLDISLPGLTGIDVLRALRGAGIGTPVLFFSMHPADQFVPMLREAGAQGFASKEESSAAVIAAIRQIAGGGTAFPRARSRRRTAANGHAHPLAGLSARERAVLHGIMAGKPLVAIAAEFGITAKSVGTYRRRVMEKLGVDTTAELIAAALRSGLPP